MSFRGNMCRNNNPMPARGGPLMTDHLQDLELELELLKRKRQLIQRQQNDMLYNSASAGNMRYNQPSQSFNDRFNEPQHLNFSHLYNETPRDNRSSGVKRRAQADWPNTPIGSNPMGGNKRARQGPLNRQNNSQPFQNSQNTQKPRSNQPQPLLNTPMPKPLMNFGPQTRRGPNTFIMPNQVSKPPAHRPNFKQNKPKGPNRPNFIAKTASPNKSTPNKSTPNIPNNNTTPKSAEKKKAHTFMPNEPLDNKLNGRLELALGMVVKEIKATYGNKPEYRNLFIAMPLTRLMKQGIRERLHSAMTGKVIGTANDILAEYRQAFPTDTDKDIVELAVVEQQKNLRKSDLAIKLLEEGDPEQYFKKNMRNLLQTRFGEMMEKLEKMIQDENKALTKSQILAHLPELKKTPGDVTAIEHTAKPAEETSVKAAEDVVNLDEETSVKDTEEDKIGEDTAKVAADTIKVAEDTVKVAEDTVKVAEDTVKVAEDTVKVVEETAKVDEETANVAEEAAKVAEETQDDLSSKAKDYDKWLSLWIQRRLPALLPNYRNMILKTFDLDHMYRHTKAAIIINATNKAQAMNISKARYTNSDQGKDDPELPRNLPYFAKVLAIPSMPKRKIMQEFLNQFQPKTIKRHKKNYNLLFVGFDSKDNYDQILAANETTLANATLSILGNVAKTTTIEIDNDINQILTPQLDDQINDLLSSIQQADGGNDSSAVANIDLTMDGSDEQETQVEEEKSDVNANENPVDNETTEATDAEKSEAEKDNNGEANDDYEVAEGNTANVDGNNPDDECEVVEANGNNVVTIEDDEVAPLKNDDVKKSGTPAKGRAPATPSSIRTRRSSRLVQN